MIGGLICARSRKVERIGSAGHIGVSGGIGGNCIARVGRSAPQIGTVDQRISSRVQLGDERIFSTGVSGLYGRQRGECGGASPPGDVCVACWIDSNSKRTIIAPAAQVGAIDESVAAGTELGHESIHAARSEE